MSILTVSDERHRKMTRFRIKLWKAIALCAALRLADAAFGLGFVDPAESFVSDETLLRPIPQKATL